jgi:hypothetical protein
MRATLCLEDQDVRPLKLSAEEQSREEQKGMRIFGAAAHKNGTSLTAKMVYIQNVLKVALPKYLVVIIRRYQMCIEHAVQQF